MICSKFLFSLLFLIAFSLFAQQPEDQAIINNQQFFPNPPSLPAPHSLDKTKQEALSSSFCTVGYPGNRQDNNGLGSVPYIFSIGRYEVTAEDYCEFLNAVATTNDPYGLYNDKMETSSESGSVMAIAAGKSLVYKPIPWREKVPITFVDIYSAARYCNWLQNGKPAGEEGPATTEQGSYDLTLGKNLPLIRTPGATYFLPTENEWYKAAYYDSKERKYYDFPNRSSWSPHSYHSKIVSYNNEANYNNSTQSTSLRLTPVGSFTTSMSPVGAFDMGGNVAEWTERQVGAKGMDNIICGGSWKSSYSIFSINELEKNAQVTVAPYSCSSTIGFRIIKLGQDSTPPLSAIPDTSWLTPNEFEAVGIDTALVIGGVTAAFCTAKSAWACCFSGENDAVESINASNLNNQASVGKSTDLKITNSIRKNRSPSEGMQTSSSKSSPPIAIPNQANKYAYSSTSSAARVDRRLLNKDKTAESFNTFNILGEEFIKILNSGDYNALAQYRLTQDDVPRLSPNFLNKKFDTKLYLLVENFYPKYHHDLCTVIKYLDLLLAKSEITSRTKAQLLNKKILLTFILEQEVVALEKFCNAKNAQDKNKILFDSKNDSTLLFCTQLKNDRDHSDYTLIDDLETYKQLLDNELKEEEEKKKKTLDQANQLLDNELKKEEEKKKADQALVANLLEQYKDHHFAFSPEDDFIKDSNTLLDQLQTEFIERNLSKEKSLPVDSATNKERENNSASISPDNNIGHSDLINDAISSNFKERVISDEDSLSEEDKELAENKKTAHALVNIRQKLLYHKNLLLLTDDKALSLLEKKSAQNLSNESTISVSFINKEKKRYQELVDRLSTYYNELSNEPLPIQENGWYVLDELTCAHKLKAYQEEIFNLVNAYKDIVDCLTSLQTNGQNSINTSANSEFSQFIKLRNIANDLRNAFLKKTLKDPPKISED